MRTPWLVVVMLAGCAEEPETTPGCSDPNGDFSMKLDGVSWKPACMSASGGGGQVGGRVTEIYATAFDSPLDSSPTVRSSVGFRFENRDPQTFTVGVGIVAIGLNGPLAGATDLAATSGTIIIETGWPEWSGTLSATFGDGRAITDARFSFTYPSR